MSSFLQLAALLAAILLSAKLASYLSRKIGQPAVLGELIVGLILGPSLLNITHVTFVTDSHLSETITALGEFGVLLLMFLAGMELHLNELRSQLRVSAYAGTLGVILPVLFGWIIGLLFQLDHAAALFLGLTMGATSVSISVQTLLELKMLRSRVGLGLLGSAVFDDVLIIVLLSIFLALVSGNGTPGAVVMIFVKILAFLVLSLGIGIWLLPKLAHLAHKMQVTQGVLSFALVVMLIYGVAAEIIGGMAAITGAFIAGLMFSRSPEKQFLESGLLAIGYGFFIPIFFISIGLSLNLRDFQADAFWLLLAISVFGIIGKLVGSGFGAKLAGFTNRESLQLGAGMISRGEVGLIVASVGMTQGLVNESEFSAVVGMVVVTTIVTPPLLRALFPRKNQAVQEPSTEKV
jgi:Kef-type K+ transport system membrane component KefB